METEIPPPVRSRPGWLDENERLHPNLMNSRRPIRSHLLAPLNLTLSGMAAFSFENGLAFDLTISGAGSVAGIFLARADALPTMAEVLHM